MEGYPWIRRNFSDYVFKLSVRPILVNFTRIESQECLEGMSSNVHSTNAASHHQRMFDENNFIIIILYTFSCWRLLG